MKNKKKYRAWKRRLFDIIQISNTSDMPSKVFDIFLVVVIIANITVMFLETFPELQRFNGIFDTVERVTLGVFLIEYALRIWTAEFLYPRRSKKEAVWRFLWSFDGIIELLTILPFFFLSGFVVFRMLRVVRIFHLFRINATYDSFNVITAVLMEKKNQILSSSFIILILMLASSICMWSAEHEAQPELFKNALSGIWWSVSALLTVGYGDIYPVTFAGRVLAVIMSFLGVGAVAIPTGIISAGFVEHYTKVQGEDTKGGMPILQMKAGIDSKWIGKSVREIDAQSNMLILIAERKGKTIRPTADYRVEVGDKLAVYVNDDRRPSRKAGTAKV